MNDAETIPATDTAGLLALIGTARARAAADPFGNPVLAAALAISRLLDDGALDEAGLAAAIAALRDAAASDRAARLARYVGGTDRAASHAALERLAATLIRPDPEDSPLPLRDVRAAVERPRFACVFTGHPTFAVSADTYATLAAAASGEPAALAAASHRPSRPTLDDEFNAANAAIAHGRDALDALCRAILEVARPIWPAAWTALNPGPVVLASWVGLDTDGRTDIGWWDSLRLRLRMKQLGLQRVAEQVHGTGKLANRVGEALEEVAAQLELAPAGPDPATVGPFARRLVSGRDTALLTPEPLLPLFAAAIADAPADRQLALCTARAGMVAHGMSLAHTHMRLNATQVHNAVRLRLGLDDPPADRSRRRSMLAAIDDALGAVQPLALDFGALLAEQSSALRLMMLAAQIAKHVDRHTPTRFLVAETRSGYTLLATLWLARLCGVERHIEISPLFETGDALEDGARVLEEALRSPHYRAYLRNVGRLCLQFGYSDSARYLGQLPASYLIERLKLRLAEALTRHELRGVEVVLFDTHGESIGRGAHPGSLADRLSYLSPAAARQTLARAGLSIREESSFQGGDGYLLFGTPALALASVARVAEHALGKLPEVVDPVYQEADFAAGFFATASTVMQELVEDPGYASLLGAFGPALLDATGSRPSARQTDAGGPRPNPSSARAARHPQQCNPATARLVRQHAAWPGRRGRAGAGVVRRDAHAEPAVPSRARLRGARRAAFGPRRAARDRLDPGSRLLA